MFIVFCALAINSAKAQNAHWANPSPLFLAGTSVNAMYEDTSTDLLYLGLGSFVRVFDGNSYGVMGSTFGSQGVRVINKYNGILYAGSICPGRFLTRWNGTDWDTSGINANADIAAMFVYNGELYVGGRFTSIGGINATGIAKFNGVSWSAVGNPPFGYCYGVSSIAEYNNELYIGGNFGDTLLNATNIMRWNGTSWNTVGNGVVGGGITYVNRLAVYNNELYIGGNFLQVNGNPGNNILKWDGNALSDVGGGLSGNITGGGNGTVYGLQVFDNELYAGGVFRYAAGFSAYHIAKWNGVDWCATNDTFNNGVLSMGLFRDTLYIGGAFSLINSTDTIVGLAKWIGGAFGDTCGNTTEISDYTNFFTTVQVYPNPSSAITTFQFLDNSATREIIIKDQVGREIWRKESSETIVWFPASEFASGMYFYTVIANDSLTSSGRFVISH